MSHLGHRNKQLSYDSRAFPPGNESLHAFVSCLPLIHASYNILVVKFLSYINSVHKSVIAAQSLSFLKRTFDSDQW